MHPKTTAVIVTYATRPEDAAACCRSLRQQGVQTIVLVDNSHDQAVAAGTKQYRVQYMPQPENIGFAAGANRGAAAAATEYIIFLNPDAELAAGALAAAEACLAQHPAAAVAGLALHDQTGRPEPRSFGPPVTPLSLFTRHLHTAKNTARLEGPENGRALSLARNSTAPWVVPWGDPLPGAQALRAPGRGTRRQDPRRRKKKQATGGRTPGHTEQETGWVSGGAMLVRTDVFRRLNGFDEQFFLYWEDVDFCRRVRQAGHAVYVVPQAHVRHQRGASLTDRGRRTRYYDQSADKYFRKHYATSTWHLVRWARLSYRCWRQQAV